jgi:hypothetical protein
MLTKLLSPHRFWRYAAIYFFYLALAILITYPLVTVMSTQMAGDNSGDAYETARHIWWYRHALQTGQPLFYQSLLAYPDGMPSMYLWAIPLRTFPAWLFAFFMPVPAAFNVMLLLRLALNGAAMCWTAYQFTRHRGASIVAGTIYLAFPAMQGHLLGAHVDLLALWAFPLYIWSLFSLTYNDSVEAQHVAPFRLILVNSFLFVLSLLGSFVLLIYILFPIMAVFMLWRLWQRDWHSILYSGIAVALGGAISLIFVLPAVLELLAMPALHEGGSVRYSADLLAAISPSFFNPLYQNLGYNRQVLGVNLIEGSGYLGVVAGILALIGVWRAKAARWWLILAVVAWTFSLGPLLNINGAPTTFTVDEEYQTYIPLPWALFQSLPVLDISRTPGRFNFVVGLCMAMIAAYGVANLSLTNFIQRKTPSSLSRLKDNQWGKLAVVVLIAFILFDYQSFFPLPTVRADIPDAITALGQRDDVRAVFDVPWDNLLVAKEGLFLQTAHGLPLIAGQVTRETPVDPAKLTMLQQTMNPTLLREASADVVIVHRAGFYDAEGALFELASRQLGEPVYADDRFAVFNVPEVVETLSGIVTSATQFDPANGAYTHLYAAQTGWYTLLSPIIPSPTPPERQFTFNLDNEFITSSSRIISIPLIETGFHTIALSADPSCVLQPDLAPPCPRILPTVGQYEFVPDAFDAPIIFANGITLGGTRVASYLANEQDVMLYWEFDASPPANYIRFVKILNAAGEQVAGVDAALTINSNRLSETIGFGNVRAYGEYRVYVGWYSQPDLTRFPILIGGADERAQDNLAYIGSFTIERP